VIAMPRLGRLAKEGSWILLGQIAAVTGSLMLVRVLTEYLSPDQYGQLALGLTVAGLVNQVVMGGTVAGAGRFYSIAAERKDLPSYLHAVQRLLAYATLAVIAISLLLLAALAGLGHSRWVVLAGAAMVYAILSGYNGALSSIQNAARQRAIAALHGGLDSWLRIAISVGVMFWLGTSSAAVAIGYACSSFLVIASQLTFLRRTVLKQSPAHDKSQSWLPQIWAYSWPFSVWGIFTGMQQISDRWALQTYASTSDVGRYVVLFQLGYAPVALVTGMAISFLGPILYQRAGDATDHVRNQDVHQLLWRTTLLSLGVTLLGFAITFALHAQIFEILVAAKYRDTSYLLPWVVLAGGGFAAGQMLATKFLSDKKTTQLIPAKVVTALVAVALNFVGSYIYKVDGVVIGIVLFSYFHLIWIAILAWQRNGSKPH
jgi:O-antigen/teichoic acid export membrane protein